MSRFAGCIMESFSGGRFSEKNESISLLNPFLSPVHTTYRLLCWAFYVGSSYFTYEKMEVKVIPNSAIWPY